MLDHLLVGHALRLNADRMAVWNGFIAFFFGFSLCTAVGIYLYLCGYGGGLGVHCVYLRYSGIGDE